MPGKVPIGKAGRSHIRLAGGAGQHGSRRPGGPDDGFLKSLGIIDFFRGLVGWIKYKS